MVKLKPGETVWYSFIVYRNRAHRNAVNKRVMQEMQRHKAPMVMNMYLTHRHPLALLPVVMLTVVCLWVGAGCGSSSGKSAPAATPPTATKSYTCPMHADVVKSAPGSCPKCGMALVEKK
jgi:hypothetical protein